MFELYKMSKHANVMTHFQNYLLPYLTNESYQDHILELNMCFRVVNCAWPHWCWLMSDYEVKKQMVQAMRAFRTRVRGGLLQIRFLKFLLSSEHHRNRFFLRSHTWTHDHALASVRIRKSIIIASAFVRARSSCQLACSNLVCFS